MQRQKDNARWNERLRRRWTGQVSVSEMNKEALCICIFFYLFFYLSGGALMGAMPECPWHRAGKKLMGKKESSIPSRCLPVSLSLPLCSTERLIRTCHRSNEYHLNCFVYGSEFGCRFNLRMCLSSCAWRGGRTESGSPNETPASVTGWRGPTRSDGFEKKFWQGGGGRERSTHTRMRDRLEDTKTQKHADTEAHTFTHAHRDRDARYTLTQEY